jgi:Sulfotransferase family
MARSDLAGADAERARGARRSAGRVPDFFIVGHPKCGTTALYAMLRRHPQIHMPVKERGFFAPEWRARRKIRFWRRRATTLEVYTSLFAGARPGQRVGEATPSYLRSSHAAGRIAALRPDAKIIAIFREPVSFLRSFHLQAVHNYVETQTDFAKAIALEDARRQGRRIPLLSQSPAALLYSDHVHYVEQLRRYHAAFPREQVLVLIYDDINADNQATVRSVLRFLDVDDGFQVTPVRVSPLRPIRLLHLYQLTRVTSIAWRNLPAREALARSLASAAPARLRTGALHDASLRTGALHDAWRRVIYRDAAPPDEDFVLDLRRRFKPQVVALSEYLDRDLVGLWGYDNLD